MLGWIFIFGVTVLGIRKFLYHYVRRNWGTIDRNNEESVTGKVVLITGANSGIGKVTAREMADRGATVILACRNLDMAAQCICDIRRQTQNGNLISMHLDLASLESVRHFASDFRKRFPELHILINNGGVLSLIQDKKKSADGYELNFATNHLGHFLLTNLLIDQLKAGKPARVVTVSSRIHVKGEIDFDDLMGARKNYRDDIHKVEFPLYANSKLANALFSQELGRRLTGSGVRSYALCPGDVVTSISRSMDLSQIERFLYYLLAFLFKTPEEGAQTILHCALSRNDNVRSNTGQMYRNCADWDPSDRIPLDDVIAQRLWTESEKLVGLA